MKTHVLGLPNEFAIDMRDRLSSLWVDADVVDNLLGMFESRRLVILTRPIYYN